MGTGWGRSQIQGCRQSDPRARGEPGPRPNLQLLPVRVNYSVNTAGPWGQAPTTTFLGRSCDWFWIVAAHAALGFLLKPWEAYS